jgi:hypothetical protein
LYLERVKRFLIAALLISFQAIALHAELGTGNEVNKTPEAILSAFLYAYPDKIGGVTRNGDEWLIEVGHSIFSWADGLFLPAGFSADRAEYTAYPFYPYPPELPPIREPSDERKQLLEKRIANRDTNPPTRHPGIFNALWRIEDQATAWNQSKTAYFFGHELLVHRDLLDELASIEEELMARSGGDRELLAYIESLKKVDGFSWRQIADTASLSYHSYGAAIDFIPKSTGGKGIYWLWKKEFDPDWYLLPYDRRHMPPKTFIEAFERRGFVWGGKWFYYDTMHFEYRPEILALSGWLRVERTNPVTGIHETIWVAPEPQR